MAGTGIASDFSSPGINDMYLHLIYEHRYRFSDSFALGLGILVMNNFGTWHFPFNLLPRLSWHITSRTHLRVAWDIVELKQFLSENLSVSAEARYDMSFFHINANIPYEFITVGAGGGFDMWLFRNFYVRVRYKELFYRNENVSISDGNDIGSATQRGGL
jgi:hypothetical protein